MNYQAWYSGAYGDVPYQSRGEPEDATVECASCGEELPAHWEDDGYVADEACSCEDEDDPPGVPTATRITPQGAIATIRGDGIPHVTVTRESVIAEICRAASPRAEDFRQ